MLRIVFLLFFVLLNTCVARADLSQFEGLYFPSGEAANDWNCNSEYLGQYGGALGVQDNVLHGTEWACKLSNPKQVEDGTQYFGECWGEPGEFRDIITLKNTNDGLLVTTDEGTGEWLMC